MALNSGEYLFFLALVFGLYWSARRVVWQNLVLLAASYAFYARWDWRFLALQPQGGYAWNEAELDCPDDYHWGEAATQSHDQLRLENGLQRLDAFLDVFVARGIPVLVVNLPLPSCVLAPLYGDMRAYEAFFLDPVAAHLAERGVPFVDLNDPFQQAVQPAMQYHYFHDPRHPNRRGAEWLSPRVSRAVVGWIGD